MESNFFKFYHADRAGTLHEGMTILPDGEGLSRFGRKYSGYFGVQLKDMPDMAQRELRAEIIRSKTEYFSRNCPSRFSCFFGAPTIHDAVRFASAVTPAPPHSIKIFEVYANDYFIADMNNLDAHSEDPERISMLIHDYWSTKVYQGTRSQTPIYECNYDQKSNQHWRTPHLEVLLPLPVLIGKVVAVAHSHMDGTSA